MKIKYKLTHRSDDGAWYYWISTRPVAGSLHEEIRCRVDWFWDARLRRETERRADFLRTCGP